MILKRLLLCTLALCLSNACTAQKNEKSTSSPDEIDSIIQKAITDKHIPSFAVGVVKDGEVVYSKAFGEADVENMVKADSETFYQLGSVTKTMTGHVLVNLIENGTLSLSDPISEYFPDSINFPKGPDGKSVTVQHIATHTSGFPHYPENLERIDPNPILGYTKEQLYRGIEMVHIETALWEEYHYSNFGYGVLGIAMENATGKSLNELLKTYMFEPAGMDHSSLTMNEEVRSKLAKPYLLVDPYRITEPWQMEALAGAGNAFSTLDDMNQFLLYLMENNKANQLQQTPFVSLQANENWQYALGCFVINSQNPNTLRIHHGGDVDGYASTINLYPEYNLGMVIMTNNGDSGLLADVFNEIRNIVTSYYINSDKTD